MGHPKKPFDAGSMAIGVDVRGRDLTEDLRLDVTTKNVTTGLQEGLGPRYGMAPIPGHNDTIQPATDDTPAGLMRSEEAADQAYLGRRKVFGVHGLVLGKATDYPVKQKVYFWLVADDDGYFDVVCSSTWDGTRWIYEADIAAGLHRQLVDRAAGSLDAFTDDTMVHLVRGEDPIAQIERLQDIGTSISYLRSAILSVSGAQTPCEWVVGNILANGDASEPSTSTLVPRGLPSMFNTRLIRSNPGAIVFYDMQNTPGLNTMYTGIKGNLTDALYVAAMYQDDTIANYDPSVISSYTTTGRQDGAGPTYGGQFQLVQDRDCVIDSSYTAICVATRRQPLIVVVQDWLRAVDGPPQQWIDPTTLAYAPRLEATDGYTENGTPVPTAWDKWPDFVNGTPLPKNSASTRDGFTHVTLGEPGKGRLRANTVYEFTYAIYDKQLGYETNVGVPAKIQTGNDDFVPVSLYRDETVTGAYNGVPRQRVPAQDIYVPEETATGGTVPINYVEYRFYYREFGTYDWLPALFIDAAKLFYYTNFDILWMVTAPVVGLPGGQPGGFNDYSPLPKDDYIDVAMFQDRAFWCSTKALYWSYRRNVFSYAGRNSAACPTGEWRGVLVHVYPGQRERDATSRLLVFASDAIYTCRATGQPQEQPVQVSPDVVLNFPLDGSDFIIEFWTSFTAFSSRAAIVAEGAVYWWGPKGAFADRGEGYPVRISTDLEPDLHTLYDPNATDEIHAVYSDQTREITWFYRERAGDGTTMQTIVYNIEKKQWYPGEFNGWVDASQQLQIDKADVNRFTNGQRTLVFVRETRSAEVQRAQYWDQRNSAAGDIFPGSELMVLEISTPQTGRRRLTLADGYDAGTLAAIVVGDAIAITQGSEYTGNLVSEMLTRVLAVDTGAGTIDIALPAGATLTPTTLTEKRLMPIWHAAAAAGTRGANGIEYSIPTRYWAPGGTVFNAYWIYTHLIFRVDLGKRSLALPLRIEHRTPIAGGYLGYDVDLVDNSDGNYQVYLPMQNDQQGFEGQAIKYRLSGVQLGARWVLQSLQAHANENERDWQLMFNPTRVEIP